MDYNINGYAEGQKLNVISRTIAAQTIDYLTAHFDFTPDWAGATIFAHFRQGDTVYDLMLNEDGDILESQHLSLGDGTWELYLHGNKYDGDTVTQRITTTIARVQVFRTGYFGDAPLPVEPSAGEQILAAAMYARDQMDNLTAEADTLPEGSEATASYDKNADKISFGIPKGDRGEKGEPGPQGEPFTLEDFEQTETYQTIVTNEQARVQAEGERESAEESRETAEQNRVTAEAERVSAEDERVSAEASRVSAEASRVGAESARVTAESERVTAEAGRVTAEESRVTAESERVAAEEERATEFAGFEDKIDGAYEEINDLQGKENYLWATPIKAVHSGVTYEYHGGEIHLYGVQNATGDRRIVVFNGYSVQKTSSGEFVKILPKGTYKFNISVEANSDRTDASALAQYLSWTYGTYSSSHAVRDGEKVKFENPVMIGYLTKKGLDYGDEDEPTVIKISAIRLDKTEYDDGTEDFVEDKTKEERIKEHTNFHFDQITDFNHYVDTYCTNPEITKEQIGQMIAGGDYSEIFPYKKYKGTDYIDVVGKTAYVVPKCVDPTASDFGLCNCFIYLYDDSKNIIWDENFYDLNSTSKYLNLFYGDSDKIKGCGYRLVLPDGVSYIRIAKDIYNRSTHDMDVFVWDNQEFGSEHRVVAQGKSIISGEAVVRPEDGSVSITLSRDCQYLIVKDGYTILSHYVEYTSGFSSASYHANVMPAQIAWLRRRGAFTHVLRIVKNYNYETGEYEAISDRAGMTMNDIVMPIYNGRYSTVTGFGMADDVADTAHEIKSIVWTPKIDVYPANSDLVFHAGNPYSGVPYGSRWTKADLVGWHVSAHTFVNAVNDEKSYFYSNNSANRSDGPGYTLVCSSFATLAGKCPYPATNFDFFHDPNFEIEKNFDPEIGSICTNGTGHCLLMVRKDYCQERSEAYDYSESLIIDQVNPTTRYRKQFNYLAESSDQFGYSYHSYITNYFYKVTSKKHRLDTPYDLTTYTIIGGDARPYRGDRSVYSSTMDQVLINIKNTEASTMYYQEFALSEGTLSPEGEIYEVEISEYVDENGRIDIKTAKDGNGNDLPLSDAAFYGVWTDTSDVKEYFEYHAETMTYEISNGVVSTNGEFWYLTCNGVNKTDNPNGKPTGIVSMPFVENDHTYTEYAPFADIDKVYAFLKKGTWGAYCVLKTEEPEPELEADNA